MSTIGLDIEKASVYLRNGELVAIPTETVYGLAGNAYDAAAVIKIFDAKRRPSFDPLIVHIGDKAMLKNFCEPLRPIELELIERYWPGPMTLILRKKNIIPDIVTSGLDTVGVRMPNHDLTLKLLNNLHFPLAAPSANPFGYISPTNAHHVQKQLEKEVSYILDGGSCAIGVESTILKVDDDIVHVLRLGGLTIDQLRKDGFEVSIATHSSSQPEAPGMLTSHYAPRKKTRLLRAQDQIEDSTSVLYFSKYSSRPEDRTLSASGDIKEAARNLFGYLRELDEMKTTLILVEMAPEIGLGLAINDRLKRACAID